MDEGARRAFARHGLMTLLGAELVEVGDGRCVIDLPRSDQITQHHGYFHAGAIGAVLDTAGGFAASSTTDRAEDVLTVEYKLNLLRPAVGDRLRAEASVLRAGKRLVVCRGEAYVGDKLCAAMQQTVMVSLGVPS